MAVLPASIKNNGGLVFTRAPTSDGKLELEALRDHLSDIAHAS